MTTYTEVLVEFPDGRTERWMLQRHDFLRLCAGDHHVHLRSWVCAP